MSKLNKPMTKEEKLLTIKKLAGFGLTDEQISDALHLARSTIQNWRSNDKEFNDLYLEAKRNYDAEVEKSLRDRANGYEHDEEKIFCTDGQVTRVKTRKKYAPDPVSMIFWLKNRQPKKFRDKQEIHHTGFIVTEAQKKRANARKQSST